MAEWIAFELEEAGYSVVIQAWDSKAGSNFIAWMHESSIHCERTLAVLSPDYFTGKFSEMEWTSALHSEKLLPVRVVDFEVPGLFRPIGYIELVGLEEEEARRTLLANVKKGRVKPEKVSFPRSISHAYRQPVRFPGSPPPIFNLPRRNPNFTGRDDLIDEVLDKLTSTGRSTVIQALTGMGGIGKSQLAIEFAHRYASDYELIWWMQAEDPLVLSTQFVSLARELDLPEKDNQEQEVIIHTVRKALQKRSNWLLVFDNAVEEDNLQPFLPTGNQGQVLITSRTSYWSRITSAVNVSLWPRDESVAFLLKLTNHSDAEGASMVADLLDNLPLALEQAAAFIAKGGLSFQKYIERFTERRKKLWEKEKPPPDYHETVATTFSMAIENIANHNPAAEPILNLLAFFAPDDIPIAFFDSVYEFNEFNSFGEDPDASEDGIASLNTYSLVKVNGDSLSIHRLVQAVIRDRFEDQGNRWAELAVRIVTQLWPDSNDPGNWFECDRLLPHATVCTNHAVLRRVETEEVALLAIKVGFYFNQRGVYAEAEPLLQKALSIYQTVLGENHPDTATSYNNLAMLYRGQGRYEEAEPLLQKALSIYQTVLGENHPDTATATSYNNLAMLYRGQGRYEEVEPLFQKALSIYQTVLGENHPDTATSYNNLAMLYGSQGRYEEAEPLLQKALSIRETLLGENHPDTATSYNNLAMLYRGQGRYEEAEPLYQKALSIRETLLGENHPDTATSYNNLAMLYGSQGRYEEAEPLLQKGLSIRETLLGENHPDTARSYNNLAMLYRGQGRYEEAEPLYQKALSIVQTVLGENHPSSIIIRENIEELKRREAGLE